MFIALDDANNRVYIDCAERGQKYKCPICGNEVLVKNKGKIKKHHFAHLEKCSEKWTSDMSDWHLAWQEHFPLECREVVVSNDGIIHRADVLIGNTVIEFQHSKISKEEFDERNVFYTNLGYNVVWVFDMINEYAKEKITESDRRGETYMWKYHWHTFDGYIKSPYIKNKVKIFFEMRENTYKLAYEEAYELYHISGFFDFNHFSVFTDNENFYFLPDIEEAYSQLTNVKIPKKYSIAKLQDDLRSKYDSHYPCYQNNGAVYYEECICCKYSTESISENAPGKPFRDIYIAKAPISHYADYAGHSCLYRFADILDGWNLHTDRIIEIERTDRGLVTHFKVYKGGKIIERNLKNDLEVKIESPGKTLLDLLINSNSHVIIASNLKTGVKVKVGNSDYFKRNKIEKIMGYISRGDYEGFSPIRQEIKNWDKPDWVLEWSR